MKLKLATRTKDGILVVDCSGRIVFGEESSLLLETVKKSVSENNHILLNLGDVDYIDSGGLGTLVELAHNRATGGRHNQIDELDQARGRFAADHQVAHGLRRIQLSSGSRRILSQGGLSVSVVPPDRWDEKVPANSLGARTIELGLKRLAAAVQLRPWPPYLSIT